MTHPQTSHLPVSLGQATRKSRSEEQLPYGSHKAETNLLSRRSSTSTVKLIPSFPNLGRELNVRFETSEQRGSRLVEGKYTEFEREKRQFKRKARDRQDIGSKQESFNKTLNTEYCVRVKMSVVHADLSPAEIESELKEAQDAISKLQDSLQNEKRLSTAKDTTIENLRHEIHLLDQELVDKRKENDKYNDEMRKLRSKTTSLETENKILERQVKMMNESTKRLHNELHELRSKLRVQETKVGELRVQRSEAVRNYAHLLQTSVDKSTRLRHFLQQVQNEILEHSVTTKKFQIQKEALENLMQEDSEEDLQFKKYGLISPRKIRRSSYALSKEEKENVRKGVEFALASRNNKLPDKSLPIEQLTTETERIVTEGLKTRLGQENEESSQTAKLMQEAKHQIKRLDSIESTRVETSKRLQDKIGTQLEALEGELKDLSDDLRMAQISKKEDEEKLRSITKFSTADENVDSISRARRASQVEKLDLESVIHNMERKSDSGPMSPRDLEILSIKRKMAAMLDDKLNLSDALIASHSSLSNLESLLESRGEENQKLENELTEKEKRISVAEESLIEAQKETAHLKEELETALGEVKRETGELAQSNEKGRDRGHRVELNFTPSNQIIRKNKAETLNDESDLAGEKDKSKTNEKIPAYNRADKEVQVGGEIYDLEKFPRESPRYARRRLSLDVTVSGHPKLQRKISKTELKLVKRVNKEVQVDLNDNCNKTAPDSFIDEFPGEKLSHKNQEFQVVMQQKDGEIKDHENELRKPRDEKTESSTNSEDNPQFNHPMRISELWKSLEEAKREKEEGEKRSKHLQDELEKREQEIQTLIKTLQIQKNGLLSPAELLLSSNTEVVPQNSQNENEKVTMGLEKGRPLEELVSAKEVTSSLHEFVFDTDDGRYIRNGRCLDDNSTDEKNISALESVINDMKKELENNNDQKKELETVLSEKEEDLRKAEEEIELYRSQVSEMKTELDETLAEKEKDTKESEKMKMQISELKNENDSANENVERCKSEIAELKSLLEDVKSENNWNLKEIHRYKDEIAELKVLLGRSKNENANVAKEYELYKFEISDLQATLEEERKQNREAAKRIEKYETQISELKSSVKKLEEESQGKTNDIEDLMRQISELKTLLEKEREEKEVTIKKVENYESEISDLKGAFTESKDKNNNTVTAVNDVERYEAQISDLKAALGVKEEDLRRCETENSDLKKETEKAEEEVQKMKIKEAETRLEKERLETSNSKLQITIDNLKKQLMDADKKVKELELQVEEEQLGIGRLQEEIKVLETKVNVKDKNLEQKVEQILTGDEGIEEIKREQEELEKKMAEVSLSDQHELNNDTIDGETVVVKSEDQSLCESLPENPGDEDIDDLQKELNEFKEQLKNLHVELKEIQREKVDLEDTVQKLRNVRDSQEKELELLRQQNQVVESSIQDTERALRKDLEMMEEKEKELKELMNEESTKASDMESLEARLRNELQERESTLAAKEEVIDRLQKENRRLQVEADKLKMDIQQQAFDWKQRKKMEEDYNDLADKIKHLTTENLDLRAKIKEKDESLQREEKLRMENMKSLDALKIKLEKMTTDDKKQRERLFSLKSACSEANEAYEIVKKQNYDMRKEVDNVKKRLSERDNELEASEKEKERMEEQILNASRTIDDLRKNASFRRDESVSPDSALGISLTSAFDFSSGPNSPNSVSSDNAFSGENYGGQETGLLCKMPTMIENFRAVVRENEVMRGKLYELAVNKDKIESESKHLTELNAILKNDVAVKEKNVSSLEDKIKLLEKQSRDAKNKVVELERNYTVVSTQADLLKSTLENREKDFIELQEKVELQEEKEKTLELYSKSVAEKFEHEASEKKKYEDLSRQLLKETTTQKNILQGIEKKLSPSSNVEAHYFSEQEDVTMATVEDKVDVLLKKKKDLEALVSSLQAECADLQLANGELQKDLTQYLESEKMRQELEGELKATRIRDELTSARAIKLEEQKAALQTENKSLAETIAELNKKDENSEVKTSAMKQTIEMLEKSNENYRKEEEKLKSDLQRADEENTKMANELKSFQAKMSEIEATNDAFQTENEKLRTDIMALSKAKCDVERTISEAERQNRKLKEIKDKEKVSREIVEAEKNEALIQCETLQDELDIANSHVVMIEKKKKKADETIAELQKNNSEATSENRRLADELQQAKKDLSEMNERYKNSVQEEENLQQKLNLANLEMAKLATTQESNMRRNDALEKNLVESKGKNEELEILLEKTRLEKANALKDVNQKEEAIHSLEAKKNELEQERQSLTNDLYVATRKVLAQQQNAESLLSEVNFLNREMKGSIRNALSKDVRNTDEIPSPREGEKAVSDNEVVMQNLRQGIRTTERNLDFFRAEAKIPEHETKSCQRDVEFINKEFMVLRNQLSTFSTTSQKLCEEIKKLKKDSAQKQALLEETRAQHDALKEENLESRDSVIQLQSKCTELESLFDEYETKAEKQHTELVRANQQISTLDSNLLRAEQKKIAHEKELLVAHEKISHLEASLRAMKDETRSDKQKIATLETESNEKQALARELDNTEATLREVRSKFDEMLKEKEEAKTELYGIREELRQQQTESKTARKEVENLKKQMNSEKDTRKKVELDLNENAAVCKTYKNNLQDVERTLAKIREDNSELEEKVSILETTGNALRKETELQAIEMKRLEEELADSKEQYINLCKNHEGSEKERKRLTNEMIAAEEKITKLQGTCDELLREKETSSGKVLSLNEALEVIIASNEETAANLKTDLLTAKKELSVTKSALERRQKQVEDLQDELRNDELKIKSLEDKKQEVFEKYWASQNDLTEAEGTIDNLRSENKELKQQNALSAQRIQQLQDTLQSERDTNEKEVAAWSDQMNKLKNQHQKNVEEREILKRDLEQTQGSLAKSNEDLKQTSELLSEKEKSFSEEAIKRDQALQDMSAQNTSMDSELAETKDALKKASSENEDLKERLDFTTEKAESLEKELQEKNSDIEDLLAEGQAKLNVVQKMKATNSGEHFAELPSSDFVLREDAEDTDGVDARPTTPMNTSMKDVVDSFHKACLASFNDNRTLQQELAAKSEEMARVEENLQKEKNNSAEMKRYLHDLEKKKAKLEDDVKRLRRRLEALKLKSIEMEKEKDNEITETKAEKILLEKDLWNTKETLEELKAQMKTSEEEKERYAKDLEASRKQIVDAKSDIKGSQQQLDALQENILQLKKRTFELEAKDRAMQQQIQEKEKELSANQSKIEEMEKLYNNANEKKAELFAKLGRAEERIANLENDCQDKRTEKNSLGNQLAALKDDLADKRSRLEKTEEDLNNSLEKCEELEIQRGSLQATNEILRQQLEATKKECAQQEALLEKEKELCKAFSNQLSDVKKDKEIIDQELKEIREQKEQIEDLLNKSEENLNIAEEKGANSFHEVENLKRQMMKIQSSACADSARKELEIGKLKAEADSLRKELDEKVRDHDETITTLKITEKENEFLKKDLAQKHNRESELKLDLTSTNSKLQSYVIERECWEREVKNVLSEIEQQKNASQSKEEKMERMRTRYEKEIGFLQERVEALEREVRIIQEANEQQRHADEIAGKLALETKDMEIDNLKLRLQASRMHTSEKSDVLDMMKEQLNERTREIADLMEQIRMLKESYHLELGSMHAELKCAQMENMLHKRGEISESFGGSRQEAELLEAIKDSRKESERLRNMLKNKMKDMKSLRKHILSERVGGAKKPGYTMY